MKLSTASVRRRAALELPKPVLNEDALRRGLASANSRRKASEALRGRRCFRRRLPLDRGGSNDTQSCGRRAASANFGERLLGLVGSRESGIELQGPGERPLRPGVILELIERHPEVIVNLRVIR